MDLGRRVVGLAVVGWPSGPTERTRVPLFAALGEVDAPVELLEASEFGCVEGFPRIEDWLLASEGAVLADCVFELSAVAVDVTASNVETFLELDDAAGVEPAVDASEAVELVLGLVHPGGGVPARLSQRSDLVLEDPEPASMVFGAESELATELVSFGVQLRAAALPVRDRWRAVLVGRAAATPRPFEGVGGDAWRGVGLSFGDGVATEGHDMGAAVQGADASRSSASRSAGRSSVTVAQSTSRSMSK